MSTITEQSNILDALASAGTPIELPGLDFETIVEGMVEAQFKPTFDEIEASAPDAETAKGEIKETKERLKEYFNTDAAKIEIKAKINEVKITAKAIVDAVKEMPNEIANMIANNLVPPTIPVPTAPGIPNPISIILKGKEKVSGLNTILNVISAWFVVLLAAANKIAFILPSVLLAMPRQIANLKNLIGTIPV